jgi:hypothetical protein
VFNIVKVFVIFINKKGDEMKLPIYCPSCAQKLSVSKLLCTTCETGVTGKYEMPVFMQLSVEEQEFFMAFLLCSGSLKEMATQMGKSYPTVRNKLDDLIVKIKKLNDEK